MNGGPQMPAIQTQPINNDSDFGLLLSAVNRLMARYGFPLVRHQGSASWLAGPQSPRNRGKVYFKLLFQGFGTPAVFGVRREFAQSVPRLAALQWPLDFTVMPATDVFFVGFKVPPGNHELVRQRVERILGALPEPDPAFGILLDEEDDSDFDEQLEAVRTQVLQPVRKEQLLDLPRWQGQVLGKLNREEIYDDCV
jgi:hypothetical protein